jgi:tRNA G26 N,N-dimethylase Trm1
LSEEEQIRKLKEVGLLSAMTTVKVKTIDALSAYGEKGIRAIAEIANNSIVTEVKEYAVQTINRVKEESSRKNKAANRRV